MKCDLEYCIYNTNNICTLSEIEIDAVGMCSECIMINVDMKELKEIKKITNE